ncbi:50S ribosomal protein L4 [Buchnera aphidicola (Mollitrichosiphum nigrofasciatum)]|uniref:50S ribosomal protein L4 n=1 Tax=Buchnera aphidicola TaxID=9 RepID=UPI0031B87CA2
MQLTVKDKKEHISVSDSVFDFKFNQALLHQVLVAYMMNIRKGTKAQKNRAEVSGSGKKPWRQKGTGRARAGSIRSPIWRSGGVTFATKPKKYNKKINKKMYRGALKVVFSELIRQDRLSIFHDFSINLPKTKFLVEKLRFLYVKSAVILTLNLNKNLLLASKNLYKVHVCSVNYINIINLINCEKVIITLEAIRKIEDMLI